MGQKTAGTQKKELHTGDEGWRKEGYLESRWSSLIKQVKGST